MKVNYYDVFVTADGIMSDPVYSKDEYAMPDKFRMFSHHFQRATSAFTETPEVLKPIPRRRYVYHGDKIIELHHKTYEPTLIHRLYVEEVEK